LTPPPKRKKKTADDTAHLESNVRSELILDDEKPELDYSLLNHSDNMSEEIWTSSPSKNKRRCPIVGIGKTKKQSKNVYFGNELQISEINEPVEERSNRRSVKIITTQRGFTQDYENAEEENMNDKSFEHALEETKDILVKAEACLEEMNLLSVKNAILMNALVMVGADL
jgi:hypothetical protein